MYKTFYGKKVDLRGKTKNKYGALKTAGYDSKSEYMRAQELKILEKSGEISDLKEQVKIDLYGKGGTKICAYIADFVYMEKGVKIIEDSKSKFTANFPVFRLKAKLVEDNYKEEIQRGQIEFRINIR